VARDSFSSKRVPDSPLNCRLSKKELHKEEEEKTGMATAAAAAAAAATLHHPLGCDKKLLPDNNTLL
jgi:hypothetical protein